MSEPEHSDALQAALDACKALAQDERAMGAMPSPGEWADRLVTRAIGIEDTREIAALIAAISESAFMVALTGGGIEQTAKVAMALALRLGAHLGSARELDRLAG